MCEKPKIYNILKQRECFFFNNTLVYCLKPAVTSKTKDYRPLLLVPKAS